MEIALKICEKIRAHQRFAAYIVIPMWPEGNPTGAATQRILFWQVEDNLNFRVDNEESSCSDRHDTSSYISVIKISWI